MKSLSHRFLPVSLAAFVLPQLASAMVFSTFDTDDEGWLASGDSTSAVPDYHAAGGNPGGYLSVNDSVSGGVWYWQAPAPYLGDQSSAVGGTLSFDLAQSSTNSQFNSSDVILEGNGTSLHFDTAYNPEVNFTSYSIDLTSTSGWHLGSLTGLAPTEGEFAAVLADLTRLRIRGEYRTGADTGSLDNVAFGSLSVVPEPSVIGLWAGIAVVLLSPRRRRR